MPVREVYESDYSRELMLDEATVVQGIVEGHSSVEDELPRRTYMTEEELEKLTSLALTNTVTVTVLRRGDPEAEPQQFVLTEANFDKLAKGRKMADVLLEAAPVVPQPPSRERRPRSDRPNYESLEHAGEPHKGRTSPEEARLVREHLDEINERLAAQGIRTIDAENPAHRQRYGFDGGTESQPTLEEAGQPGTATG